MLLLALLVIIFWVIVPGLLTGWMLREHGRSFGWGLLPGALGGPVGILLALGYVYAAGRRRPHGHRRGFRPFYNVPLVGRLHFSTAWTMAGVVAFLCAWMIGGLGYEFYTARRQPVGTAAGETAKAEPGRSQPDAPGGVAPNQLQPGQKPSAGAQANAERPEERPLLSGLAARSGQSAQVGPGEGQPAQSSQTPPGLPTGLASAAPQPSAPQAPPAASAPASENLSPTPPRPPAPSRAEAVSEVTRSLGAGGHRVHAAVSGDAQTATLSVSGASLTRQDGNQLLNGRTRQLLKSAGIRIVVFINGRESWTYIL